MRSEAQLVDTGAGLAPDGEGWFVVNARRAVWYESAAFGRACRFESGAASFTRLGINVRVIEPGQPACLYHGEGVPEAFLVLRGQCLLLVEGEERRLGPWDFVHCPPWVEHVFVGQGEGPCAILMLGARGEGSGVRYPVADVAARHGASASAETSDPAVAYAGHTRPRPVRYRDGDLP